MAAKQVISSCGQDKKRCEMYRNVSIVKCANKFMTLFCRGCVSSFVSLVGIGEEHFHAFSLDVFVPSRSDRKQNGRDQWFLVPSGLVLARKWYAPSDWRESRFQIFRCVAFSVNSTRNIFAFAVILKDYSNFSAKVNCNKSLRIVSKQCTLGKDG